MLNQRIQEEKERVKEEIERLKKENMTDSENLEELQQEYNAAIINSDESEIDKVNEQIKIVNARITRRKDKINALEDENNPVIQEIIMEHIEKCIGTTAILEEQAESIYKELQPKHQELLKGLQELDRIRNRLANMEISIRDYGQKLNGQNKEKLNVQAYSGYSGFLDPVLKNILSLLIQRNDVFKVR
jgi:cysteinyl-tRNA synthetase